MHQCQTQSNIFFKKENFNFFYNISPLFPNNQIQYHSRNFSQLTYNSETYKDKIDNPENQQFDDNQSTNLFTYNNTIIEKYQIIPSIPKNNTNYNIQIQNPYNSFSTPKIVFTPQAPTKNKGIFENYNKNLNNRLSPIARYVSPEEYINLKSLKKKEIKLEKCIENYPKSMDSEKMEIVLTQMKKSICKVELENDIYGTGFFCNIPILNDWNSILRVLITNNHVINKNDITPGKKIKLSINNDEKNLKIIIDENRITYTNKEYDVTIIEIKYDDGLEKDSFLDIDNRIFGDNLYDIFEKSSIYLLHYPNKGKSSKSEGIINKIDGKLFIEHYCDSNFGSSGGPLINLNNHKVIGIHIGAGNKEENYNIGVILKLPILKINKIIKKNETKTIRPKKPRLFCNIF